MPRRVRPSRTRRWVIDSGHAQRLRKEIGPFQGEVRGVIGTEAGACRKDVRRSLTVVEYPWHDLIDDPRLILPVATSALLQGYVLIGPCLRVVAVHAVELDAAAVDEIGHHVDHAPRFEVLRFPISCGKTRTGRPQCPYATTVPVAPIAGDQRSTARRLMGDPSWTKWATSTSSTCARQFSGARSGG